MKIRTGYSYYGQDIGILVNASQAPRVPGDAGHAQTFAYPVRYQITGTSFMDLVEGSAETREKILSASRALKDAGVRGIVADCGLMSLYQQDVAREVGIPFVGSSLCQIPFVWHHYRSLRISEGDPSAPVGLGGQHSAVRRGYGMLLPFF